MMRNLPIAKNFAQKLNVLSILLTGKGEPLYNTDSIQYTLYFLNYFKEHITELQTNGLTLYQSKKNEINKIIKHLTKARLNILCFSVDNLDDVRHNPRLFKSLADAGIVIRITLNLINSFKETSFSDIIQLCQEYQISQMTMRKITVPTELNGSELAKKTAAIIKEKVDDGIYNRLISEFQQKYGQSEPLRQLNNGATVYDCQGISFTYFDYCIQDKNKGEDIRSLIFMEDGHGYDNWNSSASILF